MKKIIAVTALLLAAGFCFGQQQARVAVAPFTATSGNAASDAETISEIFGLELQAKNVVRVYTRGNITAVMSENRFQMSDLSSDEKTASIGKAANADWVVRGQVQKLGAVIVVTASLLDVNTLEIMGGAPMYLNAIEEAAFKMNDFITTITQRITGDSGEGTAQRNRRPGGGAGATGIGIEVNARVGGTLYFQGEEIATLWDNDTYTIPIERPGLYKIRMVFANGEEMSRDVTITSRGIIKEAFFPIIVGAPGPGGGTVFYDKRSYSDGWRFFEAAPVDTEFAAEWSLSDYTYVSGTSTYIGTGKRNTEILADRGGIAARMCAELDSGGYRDWFLPSRDELDLMYTNLKAKGLGGFNDEVYWSSSESDRVFVETKDFSEGTRGSSPKSYPRLVRAVRAF